MYASLADMLARLEERELVQLTDEAGAGEIDEAKVAQALAAASSTIDAYIARAYRLPLPTVHPILVDLACDLARFRLHRKIAAPPETVDRAYSDAIKTLRDISDGKIKLDSGVQELPERPGAIIHEGPTPEFTRDKMKGF